MNDISEKMSAAKCLKENEIEKVLRAYDDSFEKLTSSEALLRGISLSETKSLDSYLTTYDDIKGTPHTIEVYMGKKETIHAFEALLKQVETCSSAPTSQLLKVDTSNSDIPSAYILVSHPAGKTLSSIRDSLTPDDILRLDLSLGASLKSVNAIQNDWFGLPLDANEWGECYSWQECFTLLLEESLLAAEESSSPIKDWLPIEDIRRALGRAIGFYLFDDVEVPCLVWNVSFPWDDAVSAEMQQKRKDADVSEGEAEITGFSGWEGALWGDPLMEGAFREPSAAFVEGYGGSPIVFERQKTKRLWYTLYVALRTLVIAGGQSEEISEDVKALLMKTAEALKDAPCY